MHPIWTDLLTPGVPLLDKVIRTIAVYVFLLVGLRLAGKREHRPVCGDTILIDYDLLGI